MFKKILFAVGLVLASQMASAVPVRWTLSGVTFTDNTSATGSFFYDANTNTYSDWDITTEAGILSAFHYTTANTGIGTTSGGVVANADSTGVLLLSVPNSRYINLNFVSALTNAGGTVGLDVAPFSSGFQGSTWECNNCGTIRWGTAGSVTSVPEPATIAMIGIGLVGFGLSRRRQI